MKKLLSVFAACLMLAAFIAQPAAAMALDAKQVQNFVGSLDPVSTLAGQMKDEGKDQAFVNGMDPMAGGNFSPYTNSLQLMKTRFGSDYSKLGGIVKQHGFKSPEDWAAVGDAVMLSYIALKTEADGQTVPDMTAMTPEMMANLPPEARAQVEKTMKMMAAVKNAPADNKAVVQPFVASLDQSFGKFEKAQ